MEQITLGLYNAKQTDAELIKAVLDQKISNPEYTKFLHISENKDRTISMKAKSILVAKIKLTKKTSYIEVKSKYAKDFINFEAARASDDSSRIKISGINNVLALTEQLCVVYMKELSELGGESFGCCHRYVECSDALKCQHPDFMTSLACSYKKNLDEGKVFYGKNKNI